MGNQLFLARFIRFDNEAHHSRFPTANRLVEQLELSTQTTHRSVDYFRDRLQATLGYDYPCKSPIENWSGCEQRQINEISRPVKLQIC